MPQLDTETYLRSLSHEELLRYIDRNTPELREVLYRLEILNGENKALRTEVLHLNDRLAIYTGGDYD